MTARGRFILVRADGTTLPVTGELEIGRDEECPVRIDDELVSRRHAIVRAAGDEVSVEDLLSRNGTRLNGKKIRGRVSLKAGDVIQVGPEKLALRMEPSGGSRETVLAGPRGTVLEQPASDWFLIRPDGKRLPVGRMLTLGRDDDNDVPLAVDPLASAKHARVTMDGGELRVEDLGSSNGTRVNGRRIEKSTTLQPGDHLTIGTTRFTAHRGSGPPVVSGRPSRSALIPAVLLALILGAVALFVFTKTENDRKQQTAAAVKLKQTPTQEDLERRALQALVHIMTPRSSGSGSIITADGLVLTNFHVVAAFNENGDLLGTFKQVEVGLNRKTPGERPDEVYTADVIKLSQTFDLALLRILPNRNSGTPDSALSFPALPLGSSDSLKLGETITVIGYPGIGGDFPTLTRGTMSGFMPDEINGIDHGWIKTDAEINYGNSGGMTINRSGELIGVPTEIRPAFMPINVPVTAGKLGLVRPISVARMFLSGHI